MSRRFEVNIKMIMLFKEYINSILKQVFQKGNTIRILLIFC